MAKDISLEFDAPPSQSNDDIYDFQPTAPSRKPRPWDRTPKSPFAAHRRGRKVWKRYEVRVPDPVPKIQRKDSSISEEVELSNSARPVKRLRVKEMQFGDKEVQQKPIARYVATLHDRAAGTPKRKHAARRSLRPDRLRSHVPATSERLGNANALPATPPPTYLVENRVAQNEEPVENVDEFLELGDLEESTAVDNTKIIITSKITPEVKTVCLCEESTGTVSVPFSHGSDDNVDPRSWDEVNSDSINPMSPNDGINSTSPPKPMDAQPIIQIEHMDGDIIAPSLDQEDLASPQTDPVDPLNISEATPDNKLTAVISIMTSPNKTPYEIQPSLLLEDRDTLEIMAADISEQSGPTTGAETTLSGALEDVSAIKEIPLDQTTINALEKSSKQSTFGGPPKTDQRRFSMPKDQSVIVGSYKVSSTATPVHSDSADNDTDECSKTSSSFRAEDLNKDIRQFHDLSDGEILEFIINAADIVINNENGPIDGGELDTNTSHTEATEISPTALKPVKGSVRQTRSTTRFSDDTSLLQDFLSRAQASKAAKDVKKDFQVPVHIPAPIPSPIPSPRRSPRKALAEKDRNSPSPQKPKRRDLANRLGTPPEKPTLEAGELDEADEAVAASKSCRRSTRKRLFAPPKAAAGAPSCIPVRRPDGTEPVVLQKSQAQELANVTRANTRRNKGQSKPPRLALKSLAADSAGDMTVAVISRADARAVGWDETLVYYQDKSADTEGNGKEATRPKVRRLRNLGATNGTPAPKKLASTAGSSNGASAPKRQRKSKSTVPSTG